MDASSLQENKFINTNCVFVIRNNKNFSCFKGKIYLYIIHIIIYY